MLPAKNEIQNDSLINWNRFSSSLIIETKRGDSTYTSSAVAIGRNMLLTAAHSVDCIDSGDVYLQDSGKSIRFKMLVGFQIMLFFNIIKRCLRNCQISLL